MSANGDRNSVFWYLGCLGLSILGIAVIGALLIVPIFFVSFSRPASPPPAGVQAGGTALTSGVLISDGRLGDISHIELGDFDGKPGQELVIASQSGAVFLDLATNTKTSVAFNARTASVSVIDVEGDGVCEFMSGGAWIADATLLDNTGAVVWTHGGGPGVNDVAAGDIDGDGQLEFVVGFNGGGGVHLLESNGTQVWRQPDANVWHVEMVDTDGDGSLEILHSNAAGQLTIRDPTGAVIVRQAMPTYLSSFSIVPWPTPEGSPHVLAAGNGALMVIGMDGQVAPQLSAPNSSQLAGPVGTHVQFGREGDPHFAVLTRFQRPQSAILTVHDAGGSLVHEEVMPEIGSAVAAVRLEEGGPEILLVGGQRTVWEYGLGGPVEPDSEPAPPMASPES